MANKYGGILAGTEEIINECLFDDKARSYRHIAEGRKLRQFPASKDCNAENMVSRLIQKIRDNLNERDPGKVGKSTENWRDKPQPNISVNNNSKEVRLERAIAEMVIKTKRKDWWNQMPIASGLIHSDKDRRRAIDLVHNYGTDLTSYDFIELKIDSDTPLFAMMETLLYGLVYLVLRKEPDWLPEGSRNKPIFMAKKIGLRVLAPSEFYEMSNLSWLEQELTVALSKVIDNERLEGSLLMEISCYWSPKLSGCENYSSIDDSDLMSILQDWAPPLAQ